jgi:hypothetical protein
LHRIPALIAECLFPYGFIKGRDIADCEFLVTRKVMDLAGVEVSAMVKV